MKTLRLKLLTLLFLSSLAVTAQQHRAPKRENVEAMKIGFITDRLDLSPAEAQNFWPVYNQYTDEIEKLRKSRRQNIMEARENMDEMSDSDAEKFVDAELKFRQDELDVMKKYHPKFKQVLSPKKVAKLYKSEEDFKRRLLEMIRDKQDGKGGGRPGRK